MSNVQTTIPQLQTIVAAYVNQDKISAAAPFVTSTNNVAGLLDKVAKTYTIRGLFSDKLAIFDGEELGLAKTLEEYYQNLIAPSDYDSTGSDALAPAYPTYMKPSYSYTLGRKKLKTTQPYDNLNRAFTSGEEYAKAFSEIAQIVFESFDLYKYNIKKELLAKYADLAIDEMGATDVYATSTAYEVGKVLKADANSNDRGIVVKAIADTNTLTWANAVAGGYIVVLDLVSEMSQVADEATGEAFIKEVKKYARKAQFISEGNSLNGNTVGASEGLVLVINSQIMPILEVDTMAGAFHNELLDFGVEKVEVDDFGSDTNNVFAMLVDRRGVKAHPTYKAVRTQENASGDFINIYHHSEFTCAASRNTFIHVFKTA